jgi:alkylation response protein AidB-like acyl-CoA dehydrogenase
MSTEEHAQLAPRWRDERSNQGDGRSSENVVPGGQRGVEMLGTSAAGDVDQAVAGLVPEIAARAAEIEQRGRIPADLFDALAATGCLGAYLPTAYGGHGLPLGEVNAVLEDLSRADGSVGWVTMVAVAATIGVALFPKRCFDEVYASATARVRGSAAPKGMAQPVDGGYMVSGRWPFASGGPQPTHVVGHCVVLDSGAPRLTALGTPETVLALMPAADVELLDNWHVVGLCGTDSCDFVARDVFVPLGWTTNFLTASPCVDIPLARVPIRVAFAPGHAAVAIGIAQGALDDIVAIAATKRAAMNPTQRLAADTVFQHTLGEQAMRLQAARALLAHHSELIWTAATTGRELTAVEIVAARSMAACVTSVCVGVVDSAYTLAGSSSLYDTSPLQRRLRDIHVATQHIAATGETYRTLGGLLVGEPVPPSALL